MPTKEELQEQLDETEDRLARVQEILDEADAENEDEIFDEEEED